MLTRPLSLAAITLLLATSARANTIAVWNFNDNTGNVSRENVVGTPTLSTTTSTNFAAGAGTTLGADNGDPAGTGLNSFKLANANTFTFAMNTTGYSQIRLSYAIAILIGTGFSNNQWSWSADGGANWTDLIPPIPSLSAVTSDYQLVNVDFSGISALNNNALDRFRVTFPGPSGEDFALFDNFVFAAIPGTDPVAAPVQSSMVLGGAALSVLGVKKFLPRRYRQPRPKGRG